MAQFFTYLKILLVALGLIEEVKARVEKEVQSNAIEGAQDHAVETGDTSELENIINGRSGK